MYFYHIIKLLNSIKENVIVSASKACIVCWSLSEVLTEHQSVKSWLMFPQPWGDNCCYYTSIQFLSHLL